MGKWGVDAEEVAYPEGFDVGFEEVTDEDGGGAALRCENTSPSCLTIYMVGGVRASRGGEGKRYFMR